MKCLFLIDLAAHWWTETVPISHSCIRWIFWYLLPVHINALCQLSRCTFLILPPSWSAELRVSWFFRSTLELTILCFQMVSFQECCLVFRVEDRQSVILNLNPNIIFVIVAWHSLSFLWFNFSQYRLYNNTT